MGSFGWCVEFRLWLLTAALFALLSGVSPAAGGAAGKGSQLFSGAEPLANGGAPCVACHALSGIGRAGAASYGPDLSNLYADYEAEGVMAVLESLVFPSMEAIYAERPLTESERLDLTAYFAKLSEQSAAPARSPTALILLGVVIVFVIVGLTGLRRFKGARQPLVEQARKERGIIQ
jgi:cytochrome c553